MNDTQTMPRVELDQLLRSIRLVLEKAIPAISDAKTRSMAETALGAIQQRIDRAANGGSHSLWPEPEKSTESLLADVRSLLIGAAGKSHPVDVARDMSDAIREISAHLSKPGWDFSTDFISGEVR